jgi:hypothetical protein
MKLVAEYLDMAQKFEQMAAQETDAQLKADLEKQAAAYRKLAEKHAKEYGLQLPSRYKKMANRTSLSSVNSSKN